MMVRRQVFIEAANDCDINAPHGMNIAAYGLLILAFLIPFIIVALNGHLIQYLDSVLGSGGIPYLGLVIVGLSHWKNPWTREVHKRLLISILCLGLAITAGIQSELRIRSAADRQVTSAKVQKIIDGVPLHTEKSQGKPSVRVKLLNERYQAKN